MNSRDEFYSNFEEQVDLIKNMLKQEDLTGSETIAVSSLQRQKANLQARRTKMQQELEELDQEIASIDQRIASMKAT